MKKRILLYVITLSFILALLSSTGVYAFEIEKISINDVVTVEDTQIPALYNLTIKNNNIYDDHFKVYTLLEAKIRPITSFEIGAGKEKTIPISLFLFENLKQRCGVGICTIQYYIKGGNSGAIEDSLNVNIMPLDEIINLNLPESIDKDTSSLLFNITNKGNIDFGDVLFTFDSDFSTAAKNITLGPKSSQEIKLELDSLKLKTAKSGNYDIKSTFLINNYTYTIVENIILKEFTSITTDEKTKFSFFSFAKTITKKNEGNSAKFITIEISKNKFEHIFTSSNIKPSSEEVTNSRMLIRWQRELEPGESFTVIAKTDYTLLIIIMIIIIASVVFIYLAKKPRVIIKKKVYKIRAKGGEFAIKLVLAIKNIGSGIENAKCVDRLPHMTTIYERFGAIKPDKIEKSRLEWDFGSLAPGEEKIVSYIIYSKIRPVGAIKIPQAVVVYNKKGKKKMSYSNKLFVLGESEK